MSTGISVIANPKILTWVHFRTTDQQIFDENDNSLVIAYTRFKFVISDIPPQVINGKYQVSSNLTITITPDAQIHKNAKKTKELLYHEQFHYDVAIVSFRVFARKIAEIKVDSEKLLLEEYDIALKITLNHIKYIQSEYDRTTRHGENIKAQKHWKHQMTACLANPKLEKIQNLWL